MAIYVYITATGALYSYCPTDDSAVADAATLIANGLTAVSGLAPRDDTHAWDAATKSVIVVPAPLMPKFLDTFSLLMLFKPAEFAAMMQSTDGRVMQALAALRSLPQIDLSAPKVRNAIQYLVTSGILTQANANLILSGQPSA